MADNKTEKATPKRRDQARRKGQVARSTDVPSAAVLLATLGALALVGPRLLDGLEDILRRGLGQAGSPELVSRGGLAEAVGWTGLAFGSAVAPIAAAALVAGLVANVAMVRFKLTPQAAKPSIKRLDVIGGVKRFVGPHSLFEAVKTAIKTAVVGGVVFLAVWPKLPELGALVGLPPAALLAKLAGVVISIGFRAGIAFAVLAFLDFLYQRRRHEKSLKMTKEEVKREVRDADVPPELRRALRRRQFEQTRRRMLAEVPTADVVVTNPMHFAVALRYDAKQAAPEVVAKGADLVAAAIRRIAREHEVPVLSNPALARALYREVELGQMIPEAFFAAVAEVLAFVYRTAGRRRAVSTARRG